MKKLAEIRLRTSQAWIIEKPSRPFKSIGLAVEGTCCWMLSATTESAEMGFKEFSATSGSRQVVSLLSMFSILCIFCFTASPFATASLFHDNFPRHTKVMQQMNMFSERFLSILLCRQSVLSRLYPDSRKNDISQAV